MTVKLNVLSIFAVIALLHSFPFPQEGPRAGPYTVSVL